MKSLRLFAACAALTPLCLTTTGCLMMTAASGDINDGSVERTAAKDQAARMERYQQNTAVRPAEYDMMNERMGAESAQSSTAPSLEELRQRVEANKRRQADSGK